MTRFPARSHGAIQHARPRANRRAIFFGALLSIPLWALIIAGCFSFWFLLDAVEGLAR